MFRAERDETRFISRNVPAALSAEQDTRYPVKKPDFERTVRPTTTNHEPLLLLYSPAEPNSKVYAHERN